MKKLQMMLVMLVVLMAGMVGVAHAVPKEIGVTFTVHAAQGDTVYPDYPDFSEHIKKGLTKENFNITYYVSTDPSNTDYVFDENGALTVSDTASEAVGNVSKALYVKYTPKKSGVGTETIFRCYLHVYSKISEIGVDREKILLTMDRWGDRIMVDVPLLCYEDWLKDVSYDSDIIEVTAEKTGNYQNMSVKVVPKKIGQTTIVLTAYNGVTASIPVTIIDAPSKVAFAQSGFSAKLGEVVDLGLDLGNGSIEPMPTVRVTVDGLTYSGTYEYSDRYYFPGDASHFHACTVGEHKIEVTTSNGITGYVWVSVYDTIQCASIEVDAEKIYARSPVRVITYDAAGKEIGAPVTITKGAEFARMEGNQLIADHAGEVELTVQNTDGTTCSRIFQVEVTPTQIILEATEITVELEDSYQVKVGFDQGSMPYTITLVEQTSTEYNLAATRLEGDTITAQAPGTATYVVKAGDLSQTIVVTIPDSDRAVTLVCPPNPFPAKYYYQFAVVDKGGRIYPATFSVHVHDSYCASMTEDGFFMSKQIGSARVTATLADGRQLSTTVEMLNMPLWLQHSAVIVRKSESYYLNAQSDVGGISPQDLTVTVADESIVKVENGWIRPQKVGKTTVTLTNIYTEVSTTFTVEVIKDNNDTYIGQTTIRLPYGYTTTMPVVTDANGKEVAYNWKITYENAGEGNPESSGFILEGNQLTCTWPSASCEITGTKKYGSDKVKVSVQGYMLPSVIYIDPVEVRLGEGEGKHVHLDWLDIGCQVDEVIWFSEDENVATCIESTQGKGSNYISARNPGTTRIVAWVTDELYAVCEVTVYDPNIPGDADLDGMVTLNDAMAILQKNVEDQDNANVNSDNQVDILDALLLLQYSAGWGVTLQ